MNLEGGGLQRDKQIFIIKLNKVTKCVRVN